MSVRSLCWSEQMTAERQPRHSSHPLPPYPFLPGRSPHPRRDPAGHGVLLANRISVEEAWNYGLDLFNCGFFWEAHEAWERVWRSCADCSPEKSFMKGMIQVCGAEVTRRLEHPDAAYRLATRAARHFEDSGARQPSCRGIELLVLASRVRQWAALGSRGNWATPGLVFCE